VDEDCDQIEAKVGDGHNCWEGLSANFRHGKLIQLTYSVEAEGGPEFALNQVLSALREEFGNPDFGKYGSSKSSKWSKGNEVLIVMPAHELAVGPGRGKVSLITASLAINEDNAKKDI